LTSLSLCALLVAKTNFFIVSIFYGVLIAKVIFFKHKTEIVRGF
jgi:hypothetical protein